MRYASTPEEHIQLIEGTLKTRSGKLASLVISSVLLFSGIGAGAVVLDNGHDGYKIAPRYHIHRHLA